MRVNEKDQRERDGIKADWDDSSVRPNHLIARLELYNCIMACERAYAYVVKYRTVRYGTKELSLKDCPRAVWRWPYKEWLGRVREG